ncbi:MAG: DHHA1 domain-containing protein, partial [Candidatus Bathyarchaeia archaeon]
HVKNTGEIGFIKILRTERIQDGVERLVYAVGIQALKAIQKDEELLLKLSEILNSPIDKLDKTVENLIKELKEVRAENRRLIKEIAKKSAVGVSAQTEVIREICGIKLIQRDFKENLNVDMMIHMASEIIEKDPATVAIFYGSNDKIARIIVMAGETAVKLGVNAAEIAREASKVIGGGGGGRVNFGQGGGTIVNNLTIAIKRAEETLEKQLKQSQKDM